MMKLSLILEAVNKASRPLDQVRKSVGQMDRAADGAASSIGTMDRRMSSAERSARGLGNAGLTMGHRVAAGARRAGSALVGLERRMQLSNATMTGLAVKSAGLLGGAIRGGVVGGGALAAAGAAGGLYKIVSAGTQFEGFRSQLEGLHNGDTKAAQKSLDWIKKFAEKTPYDMAAVTEAFISARNAGIDPLNGSLMTLGDASSALAKTYADAIAMISDAQQGSFERLPEFGITAHRSGANVALNYFDKTGKAMVKSVKVSGHNVEQAVLEILEVKFGGGMDRASKTTAAKWDTLMDKMSGRAVAVWEGGFGDEVGRQLDRATKAFDDASASGAADRWSKDVSGALATVTKEIGEADWEQFRKDLKGVGSSFYEIYQMAELAAEGIASTRRGLETAQNYLNKGTGALGTLEYSGGGLRYHLPSWAKPAPAASKPPPKTDYTGVPLMDAGPRTARAKPRAAPVSAPKAKISIDIRTPSGTTARPTKIKASGIDVEVNTGRMMIGMV